MHVEIREWLNIGPRTLYCYCKQGKMLPLEPLGAHSLGCLVLDWAMAEGLLAPADRMLMLDAYARALGDKVDAAD